MKHARVRTEPGGKVTNRAKRLRGQVLSPDRHLAAFDLENTLIASNVVTSYAWLASRRLDRADRARLTAKMVAEAPSLLAMDRRDRSDFLRHFYRRFEGAPIDQLEADSVELFSDLILSKAFPAAIRRVREHRRLGHRTLLITGALDIVVEPLAPLFDDIVCARLGREDGELTGELTAVPPTAEARAQAMIDYAADHDLDLREAVAYADSSSDLPMLEAVGFPVAVNPETRLATVARKRGWLVEDFKPDHSAPRRLLPLAPTTENRMTAVSPRPGLVLDVDRSTPPILFHRGPGFTPGEAARRAAPASLYPAEPLAGLDDPDGAIRHALDHPIDSEPLSALLHADMKLTIAFDDISLPLPKMRRPDVRQRVIEAVLDLAAEAGVDDIHLIAALALHRRMTEDELRHAVGDRVYDAFAPSGRIYNHDAEDPDGMSLLGTTPHGEEVQMNRRAAESDLIVYVNLNLVAMDGGHKSTATGLSGYTALRHHHNVDTMQHSRSFMDQESSELHRSNWRQGAVIRDAGVKIFQIETTVNNNTFGR